MAMNMNAVGQPLPESLLTYTWKDVALYALAVGATEADLDFLLEFRPMKVLPTYAVIPTFEPLRRALAAAQVELTKILHGEMTITLHRPLPKAASLVTRSQISGIYDVGKHAILHLDTRTVEASQEEPLFDTRWSIVIKGAGSFGGSRPPAMELATPPGDRPPDFTVELPTLPTQALLYRLTGDVNPLHADPNLARAIGYPRPILHGLCTYGHAALAVIRQVTQGDVRNFRSFFARFSKEVYPGERLMVEGWQRSAQEIMLQVRVDDKLVLSNGLVTLG